MGQAARPIGRGIFFSFDDNSSSKYLVWLLGSTMGHMWLLIFPSATQMKAFDAQLVQKQLAKGNKAKHVKSNKNELKRDQIGTWW